MPQERLDRNAAERQAAYRARRRDQEPIRQGERAALARTLHMVLRDTVRQGRCPFPPELIHKRANEALRHLIRYWDRACESPHAAPTRPQIASDEGREEG